MRNNAETCKDICGYNLVHNFFVYFLPLKSSLFVVHFSNAFQHGKEALLKHDSQTKIVPLLVIFHLTQLIQGCEYFDFTKLYLIGRPDYKSRISKKHIFFHYHLNLFICCKTKLKIKFMFYRMRLFYRINFFTELIFFNRIELFERGYKYLFQTNNFFKKKKEKKILEKSCIFFLKNVYIFLTQFCYI